jgi:hypothetical protein
LKKKLSPGSSLGINTKFGEKNFMTNKLTAGEICDFLQNTHRGEIEATNFQMKEAKVALSRLIDLIKADVAENVEAFATEWEKLPNLKDFKDMMNTIRHSVEADKKTETLINEYFRNPAEPINTGDLAEQEWNDFQEALINDAENDLMKHAVLRKLPDFNMNLVNLDMKLHRYVKNLDHNLSMMFNGLVGNNEIAKVFHYEWKRPFNEESGKAATSEVTCPCCKSNLPLDLKAKPDDNQEMQLQVEIKPELEENVWTATGTGGEERTAEPALGQDAPAVTAPAAESGEGTSASEARSSETSVQRTRTSLTSLIALNLDAPRPT